MGVASLYLLPPGTPCAGGGVWPLAVGALDRDGLLLRLFLPAHLCAVLRNGIETLYLTQLKFEIEISGRGVYVLNLRRQHVHMRCQISKFKVELLNMYGIDIFGS